MKNIKTAHQLAQEFSLPGGGRLFCAQTRAHDVVTVEGSVLGGPYMLPAIQEVVPYLAAELLDAGTKNKKKHIIREELAGRGISLSFSSSGDRTKFSGSCFPEDVSILLSTIVECLEEASFSEQELKNAKARMKSELLEEKTDTHAQAARAFSGLLYDPQHVNYQRPLKDIEKSMAKASRSDLQNFRNKLGKGGLVVAIVGDITVLSARAIAEKVFNKLGTGTPTASIKNINKKTPIAQEIIIPIADKANIDTFIGAALPITIQHDLYHPMKIITEMLGGGFCSHLMKTIRERDGLTYHIHAALAGFGAGADGYFEVMATFSPQKYEESVSKLRKEINIFFKDYITEKNVVAKQEEMAGSYLVSLSTTRNLARSLHSIGVHNFDLSYITDYPHIIRAVSLDDIKNAASLIPHTNLSLAASGTFFDEKGLIKK